MSSSYGSWPTSLSDPQMTFARNENPSEYEILRMRALMLQAAESSVKAYLHRLDQGLQILAGKGTKVRGT